jgi:hypothetical protein
MVIQVPYYVVGTYAFIKGRLLTFECVSSLILNRARVDSITHRMQKNIAQWFPHLKFLGDLCCDEHDDNDILLTLLCHTFNIYVFFILYPKFLDLFSTLSSWPKKLPVNTKRVLPLSSLALICPSQSHHAFSCTVPEAR